MYSVCCSYGVSICLCRLMPDDDFAAVARQLERKLFELNQVTDPRRAPRALRVFLPSLRPRALSLASARSAARNFSKTMSSKLLSLILFTLTVVGRYG